jgi:hypothetical protein
LPGLWFQLGLRCAARPGCPPGLVGRLGGGDALDFAPGVFVHLAERFGFDGAGSGFARGMAGRRRSRALAAAARQAQPSAAAGRELRSAAGSFSSVPSACTVRAAGPEVQVMGGQVAVALV